MCPCRLRTLAQNGRPGFCLQHFTSEFSQERLLRDLAQVLVRSCGGGIRSKTGVDLARLFVVIVQISFLNIWNISFEKKFATVAGIEYLFK